MVESVARTRRTTRNPLEDSSSTKLEFIFYREKNGRAKAHKHVQAKMDRRRRLLHDQAVKSLKANSIVSAGPLAWGLKPDDLSLDAELDERPSLRALVPHDNNEDCVSSARDEAEYSQPEEEKLDDFAESPARRQHKPHSTSPQLVQSGRHVSPTSGRRPRSWYPGELRKPDPHTMIGNSGKDPFSACPIPSYPELHRLIDFCMQRLLPHAQYSF